MKRLKRKHKYIPSQTQPHEGIPVDNMIRMVNAVIKNDPNIMYNIFAYCDDKTDFELNLGILNSNHVKMAEIDLVHLLDYTIEHFHEVVPIIEVHYNKGITAVLRLRGERDE